MVRRGPVRCLLLADSQGRPFRVPRRRIEVEVACPMPSRISRGAGRELATISPRPGEELPCEARSSSRKRASGRPVTSRGATIPTTSAGRSGRCPVIHERAVPMGLVLRNVESFGQMVDWFRDRTVGAPTATVKMLLAPPDGQSAETFEYTADHDRDSRDQARQGRSADDDRPHRPAGRGLRPDGFQGDQRSLGRLARDPTAGRGGDPRQRIPAVRPGHAPGAAAGAHLPRARQRMGPRDRHGRRAGGPGEPPLGRPLRDAGPADPGAWLDRRCPRSPPDRRDRGLLRPERVAAGAAAVPRHPAGGGRSDRRAAP